MYVWVMAVVGVVIYVSGLVCIDIVSGMGLRGLLILVVRASQEGGKLCCGFQGSNS
jgi:hypothetical protein